MQKAAQSSQLKNGNLGGGRVYAFRVSRINADFVSLKLWLLGGVIRARNIAVAALPDFIAQIDAALADGCEVVAPDGAEFSAPEKVLSGIRKEFSSYCCLGASDAKHALGGVATPTKPQASARADGGNAPEASSPSEAAGSVGRQFNEERRIKNEELVGEVARIVDEELRKAVIPVLAEIDAITALVKECASELSAVSKDFITCASGEFGGRNTPPAPRAKAEESVVARRRGASTPRALFPRGAAARRLW